MGYELHPETPQQGALVSDEFPDLDMEKMLAGLNNAGAPYGVNFNPFEIMPNTRLALAASEFAKGKGKFNQFHNEVFKALFTEGKDIGQLPIILSCAQKAGLDTDALEQILMEEKYVPRLHQAKELGKKYNVAGLPTFIIDGNKKIVGAQPYQTFVRAIEEVLQVNK